MPSTDLAQAVLVQLRATGAVATAFGDTWNPTTNTGVMKFFYDFAGQPDEPYLVAMETFETYDFETRTTSLTLAPYIATGQMDLWIYQADRQAARALGVLVAAALNDQEAALTFTGFQMMNFRMSRAQFVPVTVTGPNVPIVFNRVLTFDYMYSGSITEPS